MKRASRKAKPATRKPVRAVRRTAARTGASAADIQRSMLGTLLAVVEGLKSQAALLVTGDIAEAGKLLKAVRLGRNHERLDAFAEEFGWLIQAGHHARDYAQFRLGVTV